jgi:putative protease
MNVAPHDPAPASPGARLPRPELLAPAQDFTCLQAAINAGCDAVYFGVDEMNMRTAAHNFRPADLPELSRLCRGAGVRAYLALNTIVFPGEQAAVAALLDAAVGLVDAVICWDPAVIRACRERGQAIHISTQASVANVQAACFYREQGAVRIIPARECTLEDVVAIRAGAGIEVETFIHGAMCVSYSGRCFLGQDVFGKSGNRGACLQPCRREYLITEVEEGEQFILGQDYVMSARDLCTVPFIEELVAARFDAFKIEGRNRNPEYVDTAVRCYRRAIDACLAGELTAELKASLVEALQRVYNRKFSDGFYHGRPIRSFAESRRSQAEYRKEYVGIVKNYYDRARVAAVSVLSNTFRVGDDLMIQGCTTGLVRCRVGDIRVEGTPVQEAPRGVVTLALEQLVREGDKVYVQVLRQGKSAGE